MKRYENRNMAMESKIKILKRCMIQIIWKQELIHWKENEKLGVYK